MRTCRDIRITSYNVCYTKLLREDIHSQVEIELTNQLGDVGKKIHSGRSRNDQVLVDIKLFLRAEIREIVEGVLSLFGLLQAQSERYKNHLLPGYSYNFV